MESTESGCRRRVALVHGLSARKGARGMTFDQVDTKVDCYGCAGRRVVREPRSTTRVEHCGATR